MVGVNVHAASTTHIIHIRQVPLLDVLTCGRIVEHLSEQVRLLYGIHLHAWAVGVDVAHVVSVAVAYARTEHHAFHGVHSVAALQHLVNTIAVGVGHAKLVELSRPRGLVVAAPGVAVVPVAGSTIVPVVRPHEYIVMVLLIGSSAVETLHGKRRMYAIEVADGEVAGHEGIFRSVAVVHVVGAVVARIGVHTVVNLVVFQFRTSYFRTRLCVNHGNIERRIAFRLLGVVLYTVAVGVGNRAAVGVFAPRVVVGIPETGHIRTLYNHLALAVAVYVVGYHHVVLASVDDDVRSHVDGPQTFAVECVGLQLVGCGGASWVGIASATILAVDEQGVVLAVAIEIHGPCKFHLVVVGVEHILLEVDVEKHVLPRLLLK